METLVRRYTPLALWLAAAVTLSGCNLVQGVFKAGLWMGVLAMLLVVGLAVGLIGFVRHHMRDRGERA